MESVFIVLGILITITSLGFILFSKNKKEFEVNKFDEDNKYNIELEYRDLRNDIKALTKEFNRTAQFNTNVLDEKITYIKEIRNDLEEKEFKINKMMTDMEIMHNRLRKLMNEIEDKKLNENIEAKVEKEEEKTDEKVIKMIPKQNSKKQGFNDIEEEIIEHYRRGLSIKEISKKTGRSLGEIEFIMGLRKMN